MSIYNKNAEVKEQTNNQDPVQDDNVILSVKDLHVWFELRRFGFGHAGYVKAVDGVSLICIMAKRLPLWARAAVVNPA